ncbi:hypothetical protein FRC00_002489 [Tulasnella sp. 408]|nr:hypothetical protein FRC00_002489 [Tulasnella sp. 408]
MANEPDMYESHGKKPVPYQIPEYMADWERGQSTYAAGQTNLIAPNVCCSRTTDELLAAGFLAQFGQYLHSGSVQQYDQVRVKRLRESGVSSYKDDACDNAATHASVQNFWNPFINASQTINAAGKEFIMLETNTASCGGFARASDSYVDVLYLIDLALQGASIGMGQILVHNGGVGQTYNLFTPPPNNMSAFRQWTATPPYYSALIMSEVMEEESS